MWSTAVNEVRRPKAGGSSISPVHRHDARATESHVVLEPDPRALHLPLVRLARELPHELRTLREARRPERVTLREEPARGVHHPLPAVRHLVVVGQPPALSFFA